MAVFDSLQDDMFPVFIYVFIVTICRVVSIYVLYDVYDLKHVKFFTHAHKIIKAFL